MLKLELPSFARTMIDIVIAPSKKTKEMLEGYGVKNRIDVIPTGLDLDRFEKTNTSKTQVEAIKRFWHTYGKAILGGVVLGLVLLYGFRYYQAEQRNTVEQASANFSQLVQNREASAADDWLVEAQGYIDSTKSDNYAVFAAMLAAKEAVTLEKYADAEKHLTAGAKQVLISAPAKDKSIPTIVLGVNENQVDLSLPLLSNA